MAKLRRASLADVDLLVEHRRCMWQAMAKFTPAQHEEGSRAYRRWLRPRLRSGRVAGFIVEEPKVGPVASGVVWLRESQPRPNWKGTRQAYLMSIFTEKSARRRGYATRITKAAVKWARQQGVERMSLHASDAGAHVYSRIGFERTHEMRRDL